MLDSHQHFWKIDRGDYSWMGDHVAPLLRDFLPDDLRPHLRRAGITRTIMVQAADTEAETAFMLDLAKATDFVAGVVGWLNMDSDAFPDRFAQLRRDPMFVGLRPMLQDLPEDDWILRPRVLDHLALVAEAGMPVDILTFPRHLPHVLKALDHTPGLKAVVDHLSKPAIATGQLDPWRDLMAEVSGFPTVSCKVSGMVTETSADWRLDDFRPYVDHVATCFGADRLMFGSDWPVVTLHTTYAEVVNLARTLLGAHFGPDALAKIFESNGTRFYGVEHRPAATPAGSAD